MKYCKNCKHIFRAFYDNSYACDLTITSEKRISYVTGERTEIDYRYCSNINLDGQCPNYKRKAWKFWVKGDEE